MWLLPWNPNSDFYSQYDIGEQIESLNGKSIWTVFQAKKKNSNQNVTMFRVDSKESGGQLIERAKLSLKRIKTLRHPSIMKYVDSNETEKSICIVTEPVSPLADYLNEDSKDYSQNQREFSIAYGLLNVAKGLRFINNDCQLNHNNINIYSIFVNQSGVWKIGGLEYICSVESQSDKNDLLSEKYIPPERVDTTKVRHPGPPYAVDSWGFGCLVWECFNRPLGSDTNIKTVGKMPKPLSVYYNKLVQSSPRHRITPMDFVEDSKKADVLFNTPLIETILYLEEIQLVKDPNEKTKFFDRLNEELDSFPKDICNNKILPDLINAFEYGEAGSAILNPIFTIGRSLDEEAYQSKLVPCIIKLFACKDRATRSKLLQQLDSYLNFLDSNVINNQIFPQVVQGFMDSNFTIREQTVKSIIQLAPKLNPTNLAEIMTHFTRLQTRDEEGSIRANTTVCLGKIAKHLTTQIQQTVLLPSLLRMFRDPFPPARHAGMAAILANESLFNIKDCAMKILPSLCQMCLDPDLNVRRLAFKSIKLFLDRLAAESEKEVSSRPQALETGAKGDTGNSKNSSIENMKKIPESNKD